MSSPALPSFARCTWPIGGCLEAAEQIIGKDRNWIPVNKDQSRYLMEHFRLSAAVMDMEMLGIEPEPFVINRPFLFWMEREGVPEPLYTAWLNYDSWKNPGGLA